MHTFKIKASSWVIYFLTFSIIMSLGTIIGLQIIPKNNNSTDVVILFVLLLTISILVVRFAGIAMTKWTITKKDIRLEWIGQFIFHKRSDLNIKWDEIKGYHFRRDKTFDLFKLVLKNGKIIRLWHDNIITKDDFERFIVHFKKMVQEHNDSEIEKNKLP